MTQDDKIKILLENDYCQYGRTSYVKKEWLLEPEGGPNWYRTLTLDEAFALYEYDRDNCLLAYHAKHPDKLFTLGWTKTADHNPNYEQKILAFINCPNTDKRIRVLQFMGTTFSDMDGGHYSINDVLYWMQLPPEP